MKHVIYFYVFAVLKIDLEKTWRRPSWTSWIWRKPGDTGENLEILEILEKTWSFFINLWLTEGKIVSSYTLQTLTSYVFLMVINASEMVINVCFCSCPGSGEDPPGPPGPVLDLEKIWS